MTKTPADDTAWRRYEQARPRTETRLSPALLKDYAGCYKLDDNVFVTIEPGDHAISLAVTGQSAVTLSPEAPDKFFSKQMPLQVTFERDADGAVSCLVIHQHGAEHRAGRTAVSEANAAATAFAERLSNQRPFARSETAIRGLIADAQAGSMDAAEMTSQMAEALRKQQTAIARDIVKAGSLLSLCFQGVGPDGWDVYDAVFEKGRQQWRIHFNSHEKMDGLWIRPVIALGRPDERE